MSKVAIREEVLRWAIDRSGRTLEDLHIRFPKIYEWATGESRPTLKQLESLARATRTPFGYFFLHNPPDERLPIPHFRSVYADPTYKSSPDLIETVHIMQRRQAWMREFLIEQEVGRLTLVRSASMHENVSLVANRMRQALGFDIDWASAYRTWTEALTALREAIEASGIIVVVNGIVGNNTHRKLDVEEFRGFVLVDDFAPLVFVNGADGKAAQMFTLAHELAHVFFGSSAAFDLRRMQPAEDATEKACNAVAAEFLVPEESLRQIWPSVNQSQTRFPEIARHFKISEIVAARRLLDLRLISRDAFFKFYQEYMDEVRKKSPSSGGGDFYATQNLRLGKRFAEAVVQATREGTLLFSDAYRMTGLHGKTFDQFAERLGYGAAH